jgi:hypothetical protein
MGATIAVPTAVDSGSLDLDALVAVLTRPA